MGVYEDLIKFMEAYHSIRVHLINDDGTDTDSRIIYSCRSHVDKCVDNANDLIDKLELPLVAEKTGSDTYMIKSKYSSW